MSRTSVTVDALILGHGAFGEALAVALSRQSGVRVSVYVRASATGQAFDGYAAVYRAPAEIPIETFDYVFVAVPSFAVKKVMSELKYSADRGVFISCGKGIDSGTGLFPSQIIRDIVPSADVAVLSGPSFADELKAGKKTCVTVASAETRILAPLQLAFSSKDFLVEVSEDVIGLEFLGVAKNIISLACGMIDGLGLGENFRAAFVVAGIRELSRVLLAIGGAPSSLYLYGGIGDIILTSTSAKSRNFRMGQALCTGSSANAALAEGAFSAPMFVEFLENRGVVSEFFSRISRAIANPAEIRDAIDFSPGGGGLEIGRHT